MLSPEAFAVLASLLIVKHFAADGPLQSQYQLANKGKFLHPGGLLHAATHVALTVLCVSVCLWLFGRGHLSFAAEVRIVCILSMIEFTLHYAIDWIKCSAEKSGGWSERTIADNGEHQLLIKSDMFFHVFLADQMLHSLTYVALLLILAWQV